MVRMDRVRRLGYCIICIAATGCDLPTESRLQQGEGMQRTPLTLAARIATDVKARAQTGDNSRSFESEILRLEAQVPGIGGVYFDPLIESVVVLVTDPARSIEARAAVEALMLRRGVSVVDGRGLESPPVVVRGAEFAFSDLVAWSEILLRGLISLDGWQSLDADERMNRVRIGVAEGVDLSTVQGLLVEADVPTEAVFVEHVPVMLAAAKVTDKVRPAGAGLQIQNDPFSVYPLSTCTAGFAVAYGGGWGFLTAGHCSLWGIGSETTGENFHQKVQTPGDLIGSVAENPAWDASNCEDDTGNPWGGTCTDADAIWVTVSSYSSLSQAIAIPDSLQVNTDTRGGKSNISFVAVDTTSLGGPMTGYTAFKVGRTTGNTGGSIDQTCVFRKVDDPLFVLKCAGVVTGSSIGRGDSGGPVFGVETWGGSPVPYGIVTAGQGMEQTDSEGFAYCEDPVGVPTCTMLYTSVEGIEAHFGHSFDYSGGRPIGSVAINGPFEVQPSSSCTWQVHVDGGTGPFTYSWSGALSGVTSNPWISGTVSSSGYLNVTATDAHDRQDSDSFYISVDENADECVE